MSKFQVLPNSPATRPTRRRAFIGLGLAGYCSECDGQRPKPCCKDATPSCFGWPWSHSWSNLRLRIRAASRAVDRWKSASLLVAAWRVQPSLLLAPWALPHPVARQSRAVAPSPPVTRSRRRWIRSQVRDLLRSPAPRSVAAPAPVLESRTLALAASQHQRVEQSPFGLGMPVAARR